jgi:hypothetical protein
LINDKTIVAPLWWFWVHRHACVARLLTVNLAVSANRARLPTHVGTAAEELLLDGYASRRDQW